MAMPITQGQAMTTTSTTSTTIQPAVPQQQPTPERRQSVGPKREKKISGIYDGEYFNVLSRHENTLFVRCNTCGPDALQLRASIKSNGNILKHVKRRHPELLDKIREEKNIKTRGSFTPQNNQNSASYQPAEKKPKIMTFKTEDIVFVEEPQAGSECMTSSYITTSAPDDKSPYAANVMVHLQPQPIHSHGNESVEQHQQHHVITSQNMSEHEQMENAQTEGDEDDDEDHQDDGQEDCDNIEYQEALSDMDSAGNQVQHHQNVVQVRNDHRSIVGSTSSSAIHPITINRAGLTVKRRVELPRIEDDDIYDDTDPLDHQNGLPQQFFGEQPSKYPSINRTIDNDREIVALRKNLMLREFELVQQKYQLEIELLQKELEYKRIHHQKAIECLNKQLRQK